MYLEDAQQLLYRLSSAHHGGLTDFGVIVGLFSTAADGDFGEVIGLLLGLHAGVGVGDGLLLGGLRLILKLMEFGLRLKKRGGDSRKSCSRTENKQNIHTSHDAFLQVTSI